MDRSASSAAMWALPALTPRDLRPLGAGVGVPGAPVLWASTDRRFELAAFVPLPGSAAHLRLPLAGAPLRPPLLEPDEEQALAACLPGERAARAQDVLCEAGLAALHRAVCRLRGRRAPPLTAPQVVAAARDARCADCARALAMFCALLGDVLGQAAHALCAQGGVVLGGTLLPAAGDWLARSPLRRRFESRAAGREALRAVPLDVLVPGRAPPPRRVARARGSREDAAS
jgi:glucokinase